MVRKIQIQYPFVFCLHSRMPCGHHNNQSLPAFPTEHKLNPCGVFFVDIIIIMHSDAPIMATKHCTDTAGIDKAKQKRISLTLEVKLDILKRKEQEEGSLP